MLVMHQRSVFIVVGAIESYVVDDDEGGGGGGSGGGAGGGGAGGGGGGDPFTAFTLLIGRQEGHRPVKIMLLQQYPEVLLWGTRPKRE